MPAKIVVEDILTKVRLNGTRNMSVTGKVEKFAQIAEKYSNTNTTF